VKATAEESQALRVEAGTLVLDKARQILLLEGNEIPLSSTEYRVLRVLMENPTGS